MRTPTQSLEIDPDEHPSLAVGTSEASGRDRERTRVESPSGRSQPPRPARDPLAEDPKDRLGEVLGTYKLVELLGKGGMGYVYRAEHTKLGREVALKLLRADYSRRRDAVLRFFQEAKTVNRVRHRNIVDVTDFIELDDGTTFIIMELLRGQSLGRWARTGVDLPRALAVLVQICDGLGAAHAVGVIHRDLKPDNVIVVPTSDGAELVKLLDFGVAKLLNRDDEDVGFQTAAGSVIGTPAYMSPEQAGGMVVDHRSDIYSLGAIMYELFCGQPMFKGRSFGEFVRKHLTEQPVPPHRTQAGANIDPRLEQLILRALAKDPNERYGSIIELRDGMLGLLAGLETLPPQYMHTMQSGVRTPQPPSPAPSAAAVMPTAMLPQALPPHLLPLPAPAQTMLPTAAPEPGSMGQVSAPYQQYSGTPYPTVPPRAASPWWLWVVGATAAVGLGIAGAVWYARSHRAPEHAAAPVSPASTAVVEPAPPEPAPAPRPAAQLVELRFDSLPKAGVYVEGHSAELCRTPCTFNVNLGDGGPTDRRTFVVRADGYRDQAVQVDLASAQRAYSVTLEQLAATEPASASADEPAPPVSGKSKKTTRTGKRGAKSSQKAPDKTPVEEAKAPEPEPVKPIEAPPPRPVEKKKPTETIDQTETVDPFRR